MFNLDKINQYLQNPKLKETVFVDDESSIHFHWANHKVTKKIAQKTIVHKTVEEDEALWIKNKESYLKLSKNEIANYIASKNTKDDCLFDVKSISDCLDKEFEDSCIADHISVSDLKAAYYRMSLKNKIPQRNFRLSTNEKVLFCYSNNFLKETKVVVHQFSTSGILFKCTNEDFLEIIEEHDQFKIYLDSSALTNRGSAYCENEKNSIILTKQTLSICDQFIDDNFYFYVRYADINNKSIKENLCTYLNNFEKLVIQSIA